MFFKSNLFNQDLYWDMRNARDISYMFAEAVSFNGDVSSFQLFNVEKMNNVFDGAVSFPPCLIPCIERRILLLKHCLFASITNKQVSFNGDLSSWGQLPATATDLSSMCKYFVARVEQHCSHALLEILCSPSVFWRVLFGSSSKSIFVRGNRTESMEYSQCREHVQHVRAR